jgi:anthranilate phosphoribosyltransferase
VSRLGQPALEALLARRDLSEEQSFQLLHELTDVAMAPAMAGALLTALCMKDATPTEVRGFARAMRALARRPLLAAAGPLVDVTGTGGDGSQSFNLSTGSALLAAACGARVVKHGNRSVSSRCGSADVLEALGLPLPLDESAAGRCLGRTSFTFLFAPHYHPAMKALAPVRAALGVRTVFNLLGPLANPAEVPYAVIGAWSPEVARLLAETLAGLPIERVFVVHGGGGWDEATPAADLLLWDVRPERVLESRRDADDFGLPRCEERQLIGADAAHNAACLAAVLRGADRGPHRDALVMGAALVAEVTGLAAGPRDGAALAAAAIDDGRAARLLDDLVAFGREVH